MDNFGKRLAQLRREKGFSQSKLASAIGLHVSQVRKYEYGTTQPTLSVLQNLAKVLGVSGDCLLFGEISDDPDTMLRQQFEAIKEMAAEEKKIITTVIDSLILREQAKKWAKK